VLEIPSGVWADATSRRLLLVVAPLLSAAAFGLWTVAPSYPAFAAGFVLWGAQGALQSGALEALVFEELDRVGAAARYARVMGRATAAGTVASMLAMGLAAPAFAAGGFGAVGAASVLACLAAAAVATSLPEHRSEGAAGDGDAAAAARDGDAAAAPRDGGGGLEAYASVVRAGLAEVRSRRAVRGAVLLVPAVTAVWGALDEYVPLLAAGTGAGTASVALLALLVYAGVALGGAAGGRAAGLSRRGLARLLAVAAAALALGAASGVPAGFVLIAASFGLFQAATVAADARLQDAIAGPARSTVTSLAGLATEALVLAVYAGYGAASAVAGDATLFACFAGAYLVVAAALLARPRSRSAPRGRVEERPDLAAGG
jgi:hypothetical protein